MAHLFLMPRNFRNGARTLTVYSDGSQLISEPGVPTLFYDEGVWCSECTTMAGDRIVTQYEGDPEDPSTWTPLPSSD